MKAAVGIDIGGSSIKSGLVTWDGAQWQTEQADTQALPDDTFSTLCATVLQQVDRLSSRVTSGGPVRLGISTTGTVNCDEVVVDAQFFRGYNGTSWQDVLNVSRPGKVGRVRTINDGNAAAWAEYLTRADPGLQHSTHLSIGTGIAGGIVAGGKLVVGSRCAAGEVGHIIVVREGRLCPCGRQGCVEAYAGTSGILQNFVEDRHKHLVNAAVESPPSDFRQLLERARSGHQDAIGALEEAGRNLGIAVATLINILNPQLITLGGGVIEGTQEAFGTDEGNPLLSNLRRTAIANAQEFNVQGTEIDIGTLGNKAGWVGAGMYAITQDVT